jgi:Xaa-Pro aminopeptidase
MSWKRIKQVFKIIEEKNLDGIFSQNPSTVQYLTGIISNKYPPRSIYVLLTREKVYALTYPLEYEQSVDESKYAEVIKIEVKEKLAEKIIEIIGSPKNLGIESNSINFDVINSLSKKNLNIIDVTTDLWEVLSVKESEEIEKIKEAIEITEKALKVAEEMIHEGKYTEKYIAKECLITILNNGGEWFAFEPIIASGKNGAYPHASTSNEKIAKNSLTIVDIGAKFNGYCADLTRTFANGEIDDETKRNFEIIKEAINLVVENIKEGVVAKDVDNIVRTYLREKNLDKYFIHGLGHGLGLDVHEYPRLNQYSKTILKEGMILTVEPGIYFKGKYGIRLEQDVLVKKDKCEILSSYPLAL